MTAEQPERLRAAPRRSTALDLAVDQLRGVEGLALWSSAELAGTASARTGHRENRLDAARRRDVIERQRQAMLDRLDAVHDATRAAGPTAVLAHRDDWLSGRVTDALAAAGVQVIARVSNGADAVGVCAAEQPDLLLVEDQLPMLAGTAVVQAVQAFSPRTRVVAQAAYPDRIHLLLEAGAAAAFLRQVAPTDVARALTDLAGPAADRGGEDVDDRHARPAPGR